MTKPICCVTTMFNATRTRLQYLHQFVRQPALRHIPVIVMSDAAIEPIVKLRKQDQLFILPNPDRLWQKEYYLNRAAQLVDGSFDAILQIDADLFFDNNNPNQTLLAPTINAFEAGISLVQLYSEIIDMDKGNTTSFKIRQSFASKIQYISWDEIIKQYEIKSGPAIGGAWGYTLEFTQLNPWYDNCILGGGDAASAWAWFLMEHLFAEKISKSQIYTRDYLTYCDVVQKKRSPRTYFLNNSVRAYWHGESINRQYHTRHERMPQYDPINHLIKRSDSGLVLSPKAKEDGIDDIVNDYFYWRNDQ